MKKSLFKNNYIFLQIIIALILIDTFILSYFIFHEGSYWYYFFLDITTSLITLLFATFVVEKTIDNFRRKEEEKKWSTARSYAYKDIGNLARGLATTIFIYTKTKFTVQDTSSFADDTNNYYLGKIEQIDDDHLQNFFDMLYQNGDEIKNAVMRDKVDIESTISFYKDVLPPHIIQPLWALRSSMNRFAIAYTESYDILILPKSAKQPEIDKSLQELAVLTCKNAFKSYIASSAKLLKTMESFKEN